MLALVRPIRTAAMLQFTDALTSLISDIATRVPALGHVRTERTLVFARRGRTGADGPNATCHSLTVPTTDPGYYFWSDSCSGRVTRRSPWFVTKSPMVTLHGTPIDYMISVALPRFSDQRSRRKLERYKGLPAWVTRLDTIIHELYHIAPDGHGLRRLPRDDGSSDHRAHPPRFFSDVAHLVHEYIESRPPAEVLEVLQHDFAGLVARHGQVLATTFRDASYPQRYVEVLHEQPHEQPLAPDVVVVPMKVEPWRASYTERDLTVRDFSRVPRPIEPMRAA